MNSLIKKTFKEDERKVWKELIAKDETIIPMLVRLLENKLKDLGRPVTEGDITSNNWSMVSAYRDGGEYYLNLFLQMLKEKIE